MVKSLAVRDALNMALDEELARDDKVLLIMPRRNIDLQRGIDSQSMDSHLLGQIRIHNQFCQGVHHG